MIHLKNQGEECSEERATQIINDSDAVFVFACISAVGEFIVTAIRQTQKTRDYLIRIDRQSRGIVDTSFTLLDLAKAMGYERDQASEYAGNPSEFQRPIQPDLPPGVSSLSSGRKILYYLLGALNWIFFFGSLIVNAYVSYKGLPAFFKSKFGIEVGDAPSLIEIGSWILAIGNTLGWWVINWDEFINNVSDTTLKHTIALTPDFPEFLEDLLRNSPFLYKILYPILAPLVWLGQTLFPGFTLKKIHSVTDLFKDLFYALSRSLLKTWVPILSTLAVAGIFFLKLLSDKYGGLPLWLALLGAVATALNNLITRIPSLENKDTMWSIFKFLLFSHYDSEKVKDAVTNGTMLIPAESFFWLLGTVWFSFFHIFIVLLNHLTEYGDTINSIYRLLLGIAGVDAKQCDHDLTWVFYLSIFIALAQFSVNAAFKAGKVIQCAILPSLTLADTVGQSLCCKPEPRYMTEGDLGQPPVKCPSLFQTARCAWNNFTNSSSADSDRRPLHPNTSQHYGATTSDRDRHFAEATF